MPKLNALKLFNFRCYDRAALDNLPGGLIVLHGPNGAGKTNILEAVSLLSPGRGLRGVRVTDIQRHGAGKPWAVSAVLEDRQGPVKVGTGLQPEKGKRIVRINGKDMRSQNALAEYFSCVWLTPQMDRLFLDSGRDRRKFLDRLVFAFDPGHAGRVTRYENALRQRSKLLTEGQGDPAWLGGLEEQIAETGIAIAAARSNFAERLQEACKKADNKHFPRADIAVAGILENLLEKKPALEVEDIFKSKLKKNRARDAETGGAADGPHKSDMVVHYAEKNMPAAQCSTGEQKALLTGIVLAHARLIGTERGESPALLLDEVAAHLDENRRAALFDILENIGGQVWLTGTDRKFFSTTERRAQFFEIKDGRIREQ